MNRPPQLVCAVAMVALSGCMIDRDFRHPDERVTLDTAYTLGHRQVRVDVGANAAKTASFAGNVDLGVGFGKHAEVSSNLGHMALGLINARGKYNFFDHERVALAAELGLLYTSPTLLWPLSDEQQDDLGDVHIISVPIRFQTTVKTTPWLDLTLGLGYTGTWVPGVIEEEVRVYDSDMGLRSFYLEPAAMFYVGGKVAVFVGAHLPPYTAAHGQLLVTETVAPGIEGGIRSAGWESVPFASVVSAHAGVELRFGRRTHLQLFVAHNTLARLLVPQVQVLPGFNFYWRFP